MSTRSDPWHWHKRAQAAIAQAALTNSKRPECLVKGVYPTHLKSGHGAKVWDMDGKEYCDFICGLGTNLLGYAEPEVTEAIRARALRGASLSLGTDLEVEAAEKVKEMFPFVDRVKFLKTGSEACSAAIKIARAYTGRQRVLSAHYHGWHDPFVSLTRPALGVPPQPEMAAMNDAEIGPLSDVAAVIIEPVVTDASEARVTWLRRLKESCARAGTVLIFDEIITGFRFPKYSVASYFGITPDLICLGKAIANGMPLAAVGGREEIMECGEYFVSSTYAGETLSLAAAKKTMELLQTKYDLAWLWENGMRFLSRFNELLPGQLAIQGYGTRGVFIGDTLTKALFWQEACKAGLLFGPSWFFNFKHIELTDAVLSACQDIATRLKTGSVKLEGELPSSPFAQRMRETI